MIAPPKLPPNRSSNPEYVVDGRVFCTSGIGAGGWFGTYMSSVRVVGRTTRGTLPRPPRRGGAPQ
jgi:hypothetical protein